MKTQLNGYIVEDEDAALYRLFGYVVCSPADIRRAVVRIRPARR